MNFYDDLEDVLLSDFKDKSLEGVGSLRRIYPAHAALFANGATEGLNGSLGLPGLYAPICPVPPKTPPVDASETPQLRNFLTPSRGWGTSLAPSRTVRPMTAPSLMEDGVVGMGVGINLGMGEGHSFDLGHRFVPQPAQNFRGPALMPASPGTMADPLHRLIGGLDAVAHGPIRAQMESVRANGMQARASTSHIQHAIGQAMSHVNHLNQMSQVNHVSNALHQLNQSMAHPGRSQRPSASASAAAMACLDSLLAQQRSVESSPSINLDLVDFHGLNNGGVLGLDDIRSPTSPAPRGLSLSGSKSSRRTPSIPASHQPSLSLAPAPMSASMSPATPSQSHLMMPANASSHGHVVMAMLSSPTPASANHTRSFPVDLSSANHLLGNPGLAGASSSMMPSRPPAPSSANTCVASGSSQLSNGPKAKKRGHSEVERKRRDRINDRINDLKNVVPSLQTNTAPSSLNKTSILTGAVEHLSTLVTENRDLRFETEKLHKELASLQIAVQEALEKASKSSGGSARCTPTDEAVQSSSDGCTNGAGSGSDSNSRGSNGNGSGSDSGSRGERGERERGWARDDRVAGSNTSASCSSRHSGFGSGIDTASSTWDASVSTTCPGEESASSAGGSEGRTGGGAGKTEGGESRKHARRHTRPAPGQGSSSAGGGDGDCRKEKEKGSRGSGDGDRGGGGGGSSGSGSGSGSSNSGSGTRGSGSPDGAGGSGNSSDSSSTFALDNLVDCNFGLARPDSRQSFSSRTPPSPSNPGWPPMQAAIPIEFEYLDTLDSLEDILRIYPSGADSRDRACTPQQPEHAGVSVSPELTSAADCRGASSHSDRLNSFPAQSSPQPRTIKHERSGNRRSTDGHVEQRERGPKSGSPDDMEVVDASSESNSKASLSCGSGCNTGSTQSRLVAHRPTSDVGHDGARDGPRRAAWGVEAVDTRTLAVSTCGTIFKCEESTSCAGSKGALEKPVVPLRLEHVNVKEYAAASMKLALDSMFVADALGDETCIRYVSPGLLRLTCLTLDDLVGKPLCALQGPDASKPDVVTAALTRALKPSPRHRFPAVEVCLSRGDGHAYPALVHIQPMFDASGVVTSMVGLMLDLSSLKKPLSPSPPVPPTTSTGPPSLFTPVPSPLATVLDFGAVPSDPDFKGARGKSQRNRLKRRQRMISQCGPGNTGSGREDPQVGLGPSAVAGWINSAGEEASRAADPQCRAVHVLAALMSMVLKAFVVVGPPEDDLCVRYVSGPYAAFTEHAVDQVLGRPFDDLLSRWSTDSPTRVGLISALREGHAVQAELMCTNSSDSTLLSILELSPLVDSNGHPRGSIAVFLHVPTR